MDFGWFGWAITSRNGVGHGFKREGGMSLCGKVKYRKVRTRARYRPCLSCLAAWSKQYPKVAP